MALRQTLDSFRVSLDKDQLSAGQISLPDSPELGDLQAPYNALLLRWKEWQALRVRGTSNQQRKGIVNEQIGGLDQVGERLYRQLELLEQEYALLPPNLH